MTNSRARAGPARSAIRWTPPPNGVSPTTRSTSPNCGALGGPDHVAAQRGLEAGGQAEAVDEREGRDLERLERLQLADARRRRGATPSSPPETSAKTLPTSTPPVKTLPSARKTIARASEAATSSRAVDHRLEGLAR